MFLKLSQHTDPVKGFRLGGQVTREEYLAIGSQVEEAIEQFGAPLCLLIEVKELEDMPPLTMWEDLKFSVKHWGEVGHLALVGSSEDLKHWPGFGSRLISTKIKHFQTDELHQAWQWLQAAHARQNAKKAHSDRSEEQPREYDKILAAVDLAPSARYVAACAQRMVERFGARLILMHVVDFEPAVALGYGWEVAANIDHDPAEFEAPAIKRLGEFASEVGLEDAEQVVSTGDPKFRILEACDERDVDLIVIGSRARHGLSRLLGSTANGVVHRANCDVLTVRVPRDS